MKSRMIIERERNYYTSKYLSEALLFGEYGENMLCTKNFLNVRNNFCTQHVLSKLWVSSKIRASDKDLPVLVLTLE